MVLETSYFGGRFFKIGERSGIPLRSEENATSMWRMIVVVFIPIAVRVPSLTVFIPPAMAVFPAPFARCGQFSAAVGCLRTIPAMLKCRLVQIVVCLNDALLAGVVSAQLRCSVKHKSASEGRNSKQGFPK
jgi:hypothetical protein